MPDKRYKLRKQVKSVRWMIFWVVLARFAAEVGVEAATSFMANPPHDYIRIAIVEIIAIGVPVMLYAKTAWNGKSVKDELCLKKCRIGFILLAVVLGVCGQFVMMILNIPGNFFVNSVLKINTENAIPVAVEWYDFLLGVVCVVVIPAVLEEFWMRGIIFRAYNRCNTVAAILFTSIVFAFLHMRLNEVAGFLFMGITASVILVKSCSLYAAMTYHAFSNLTALLFSTVIMPGIYDVIWPVLAGAVLVFAAAFILLIKQKGSMAAQKSFKAGGLVINSIFSLPIILSVAVAILKCFIVRFAG